MLPITRFKPAKNCVDLGGAKAVQVASPRSREKFVDGTGRGTTNREGIAYRPQKTELESADYIISPTPASAFQLPSGATETAHKQPMDR